LIVGYHTDNFFLLYFDIRDHGWGRNKDEGKMLSSQSNTTYIFSITDTDSMFQIN